MKSFGFVICQTGSNTLGKYAGFDTLGLYFPHQSSNVHIFNSREVAEIVAEKFKYLIPQDLQLKVVETFVKIDD